MIVRAKTPKGLSWAGRIAVLGMAALVLPLAPSWGRNNEAASIKLDQLAGVERSQSPAEMQPGDREELTTITEQCEKPQDKTHDQLLAQAPKDDDKNGKAGDDKDEKARDAAERFQEQLKDLIDKLGKELSPVAEEVRKSLEKAVGEIHKSLEKEGLSPEDLAKALDKSHEDLRKAFEGGGPVDKELREAIENARKDMQEAFDRTRGDVENKWRRCASSHAN